MDNKIGDYREGKYNLIIYMEVLSISSFNLIGIWKWIIVFSFS